MSKKAARHTVKLQILIQELEERRTDRNTHQVDYIVDNIKKGWTEKQLAARLKQSRKASDWQAKHGPAQYRQGNQSNVKLFDFVIEFLSQPTKG